MTKVTARWQMRPYSAFILVLMAVWQILGGTRPCGFSSFGDPACFDRLLYRTRPWLLWWRLRQILWWRIRLASSSRILRQMVKRVAG